MALTTRELEFLSREIRRILRPNGLNIYTAWHTGDPHYQKGVHHGENLYENNRFIVHYFSRDKIRHLARGYKIINVEEFDEGALPRKLFKVTMRRTV